VNGESRLCPKCGANIEDDVCPKCGFKTPPRPIELKLSEIVASLVGRRVRVNVQIKGESGPKALPSRVVMTCAKCGAVGVIDYDSLDSDERLAFLSTVVFSKKRDGLSQFLESDGGDCRHVWAFIAEAYMDYSQIYVSDLLDPHVKFDARTYKTHKAHLIIEKAPPVKKATIEGWVSIDPSTKDLTIIADRIRAYEDEATHFQPTPEDREAWAIYFEGRTPEEMRNQVAPDMVGRPRVQKALLLLTHSVAEIPDIYGRIIRGNLRVILIGDTKTCKSLCGKDLTIEHYGLGDYIVGESSSRTGITYTIDSDNHALIWGALPMNDLGLLVIDGMHTILKEEWKETREALENQRVVVSRSVSGEALARTRVLGILNPGRKDQKPMRLYTYPCLAIRDTWIFSDPADVTRWDIFIPFSTEDVPKDEIANAKPSDRPIPDEVFLRHVYWVWSRRPDQIEYTDEAVAEIRRETKNFIGAYVVDDIPIVHLGYRNVITRLSVACAALGHSTDPGHVKIIVRQRHVREAADFLRGVIGDLELVEYKAATEGRLTFEEEEIKQIIADLDETAVRILHLIKIEGKSSKDLASALGLDEKTVKRRYAVLNKHGLVNTRPGVGVELSSRGIIFLKRYLRDMGTKTVPNGGEKGSETVPKSLSIQWRPVCNIVNLSRNEEEAWIIKTVEREESVGDLWLLDRFNYRWGRNLRADDFRALLLDMKLRGLIDYEDGVVNSIQGMDS